MELSKIENVIKDSKFKVGKDYSLHLDNEGGTKIYTIFSKKLKSQIDPFPRLRENIDEQVTNGETWQFKDGLSYSYKPGKDDNGHDKFIVTTITEAEKNKRIEENNNWIRWDRDSIENFFKSARRTHEMFKKLSKNLQARNFFLQNEIPEVFANLSTVSRTRGINLEREFDSMQNLMSKAESSSDGKFSETSIHFNGELIAKVENGKVTDGKIKGRPEVEQKALEASEKFRSISYDKFWALGNIFLFLSMIISLLFG